MSSLEFLTGRPYLSYSALDSYLTCGERFRLERVVSVPQSPAFWFIGGSAFHLATEWMDKEPKGSGHYETLWRDAWAECYLKDVPEGTDPAAIRAGGRATKEFPQKETQPWWDKHGPLMLEAYATWRKTSGWHIEPEWVELPFDLSIGDTLVHGYIDRLAVTPDGQPIVLDLKTGSRTPASTLQLGVYALGVEKATGIRPILGSYYMSRTGQATDPKALVHYTPELLGDWFDKARKGIENELFIPHVTALCGTCSVAPYCVAVGGTQPLARTASA